MESPSLFLAASKAVDTSALVISIPAYVSAESDTEYPVASRIRCWAARQALTTKSDNSPALKPAVCKDILFRETSGARGEDENAS